MAEARRADVPTLVLSQSVLSMGPRVPSPSMWRRIVARRASRLSPGLLHRPKLRSDSGVPPTSPRHRHSNSTLFVTTVGIFSPRFQE